MNNNPCGVSVIIPTAKDEMAAIRNLISVITSLDLFHGPKELILVVDRMFNRDDFLTGLAASRRFIKLLATGGNYRGSAYARLIALRKARHQVILFIDDDCAVSPDWVTRMYESVMCHGVVTGNLVARQPFNMFGAVDAYIDQLRIRTREDTGGAKYLSFPNFGINRDFLPSNPFSADPRNTTEDIELACRLRLDRKTIHFDDNIVVSTEYPSTFTQLLGRKKKHAKGIALLRHRLGDADRKRIGLAERPGQMFLRWARLSLNAQLKPTEKLVMLLANAVYCMSLTYYDWRFTLNRKDAS